MERMSQGNKSSLMKKIQELDFALYETILYLDAYPDSCEALAHYHSLMSHRNRLASEYESRYAPITAYGNTSHTDWDWVKGPWPWEYEAN